jgi:hypothetical protein
MALPVHEFLNSVPILELSFSTYKFITFGIMAGVARYIKLVDTSAIGKLEGVPCLLL